MIYIFGDSHIWHESQSPQLLACIEKITQSPQTTRLIFMGDMLDVCIGNHAGWLHQYHRFFQILKNTRVPITYIIGNRDFSVSTLVAQHQFKLVSCHHELELSIDNRTLFLTHGDLVLSSIWKYRLFRHLIRNRLITGLIRCVPFPILKKIARYLSLRSYFFNQQKRHRQEDTLQAYQQFILEKWRSGFTGVILGHSHHADWQTSDGGQFYLNCGFWPVDRRYFTIQLDSWRIQSHTLPSP